jgi:hypothetical protein
MQTRQVTWGEALVVELFKTDGGLKAAVNHIANLMGKTIGTRNTFAKLTRADDPAELADKDLWRAWLLLTALGHDPIEWGIDPSVVPGYIDIPDLRRRLLLPRMDSNHQPSVCEFGSYPDQEDDDIGHAA